MHGCPGCNVEWLRPSLTFVAGVLQRLSSSYRDRSRMRSMLSTSASCRANATESHGECNGATHATVALRWVSICELDDGGRGGVQAQHVNGAHRPRSARCVKPRTPPTVPCQNTSTPGSKWRLRCERGRQNRGARGKRRFRLLSDNALVLGHIPCVCAQAYRYTCPSTTSAGPPAFAEQVSAGC